MRRLAVLLLTGNLFACSSTPPPKELVEAREVLRNARLASAHHAGPADLHDADEALKVAEAHYADSPGAELTRATAYIAHRRALWAVSRGNEMAAQAARAAGEQELARLKQAEIAQAQQPLGSAKEQRQDESRQGDESTDTAEKARRAGADAERRTKELLDKIKGTVTRVEARRLVITLSASMLFAAGKTTFLPAAQPHLREVANALKDDPRPVAVLGQTETPSDDDAAMKLYQLRAEAVRTFLSSHGVPSDRVTAKGAGKPALLGNDETAAGGGNNPRVEIVLGE